MVLAGCGQTDFAVVGGDGGYDVTVPEAGSKDVRARDSSAKDAAKRDAGSGDARAHGSSARDAAATDAASRDARTRDSGAKDAAAQDAGSVCGSTAGNVIHVFAPDGSFAHNAIVDGIMAATSVDAATSYVCVGPGQYAEADLVVPPNVTVVGVAGPASTTIVGRSTQACKPDQNLCALELHRGAALHGFTVVAPAGLDASVAPAGPDGSTVPQDGIVTLAPNGTTEASLPPPALWDVTVTGFSGRGCIPGQGEGGGCAIVATSDVDVGPGVRANSNTIGLVSSSPVPAIVHIRGSSNEFNSNGSYGMAFVGAASLIFEGGTAESNQAYGIHLAGYTADGGATLSHTITGLTATGNGSGGVHVPTPVQYLTIRSSTILASTLATSANGAIGLFYEYGPASGATPSPLDIGTDASPGGNTFGIESGHAGYVTTGAGIFLCQTSQGTQPANADHFANCSPVLQKSVGGCGPGWLASTYNDIVYEASGASGPPVVVTNCSPGS